MNKNEHYDSEDIIDLTRIFHMLIKNIKLIIILSLAGSLLMGVYSFFIATPMYTSTSRIFLKPETLDSTQLNNQLTGNDKLINNYAEIMKGNNIRTQVANIIHKDVSVINNSMSISITPDTQIINISATTSSPELSMKMVTTSIDVFMEEINSIMGEDNIIIVDHAQLPKSPVSPNKVKNIVIGGALGFIIACGYITLTVVLDTRIHTREDFENYLDIPVLGVIPDVGEHHEHH